MDFRSGIGLNGLHLPHLPPPNHPIAPAGLFYHLTPSSGCVKNPGLGSGSHLHLSNGSPRTCATIQPSLIPKREDMGDNGTSSFAAALRNLAKNVAMNSIPSSCSSGPSSNSNSSSSSTAAAVDPSGGKGPAESPAQNALLDVRKGFDRQEKLRVQSPSSTEKVPALSIPHPPPQPKSTHHPNDTGFQPYRALSENTILGGSSPQGICNGSSNTTTTSSKFIPSSSYSYPVYPNSHLPYPVSYEPSTLYRTPYESYMAGMLPGIPPAYPPSFVQKENPGDTSPGSSTSSRKEQSSPQEGPPSKKKKCLFVRPFEDNYSSQKKPSCTSISSSFKEPVMNATAYHPPPSENNKGDESMIEEEGSKRRNKSQGDDDQKIKYNKEINNESIQIHTEKKSSNAKNGSLEEKKELSESFTKSPTNKVVLKNSGLSIKPSSFIVEQSTALKIPSNRKRKALSSHYRLRDGNEKVDDSFSSPPSLFLPSTPPHLNKLPESNAKSMFLNVIGLTRIPDSKKQEMEDIWNVALEDRIHRNALTTTTKYLIQLRRLSKAPFASPKSCLGFLPPQLVKPRKTPHFSKLPIDLGTLLPVSKSLLSEVKSCESGPPSIDSMMSGSTPPPAPSSAILNVGSSTFELKSVVPAWTGVEGVIKGYIKYHEERDKEIQKLNQQLTQLKQDEAKKRSRFDMFTTQMATNVRYKNMFKNKRHKLKENIKELVDLLKKLRKIE